MGYYAKRFAEDRAGDFTVGRVFHDEQLDACLDHISQYVESQPQVAWQQALDALSTFTTSVERGVVAHREIGLALVDMDPRVPGALYNEAVMRYHPSEVLSLWAWWNIGRAHQIWDEACYAENVPPPVYGQVAELMDTADELARRAISSFEQHGPAHVARLHTQLHLGGTRREFWHRFNQAVVLAPNSYMLHAVATSWLSEKWYGSHRDVWEFATGAAAGAPPNSPVKGVVFEAAWHIDGWHKDAFHGEIPAPLRQLTDMGKDLLNADQSASLEWPHAQQRAALWWVSNAEAYDKSNVMYARIKAVRKHLKLGGKRSIPHWGICPEGRGKTITGKHRFFCRGHAA